MRTPEVAVCDAVVEFEGGMACGLFCHGFVVSERREQAQIGVE